MSPQWNVRAPSIVEKQRLLWMLLRDDRQLVAVRLQEGRWPAHAREASRIAWLLRRWA